MRGGPWRRGVAVVSWLAAGTARAVERFPRPQFEQGHVVPGPTAPSPDSLSVLWLYVVVLALALILTAVACLRWRSRRWVVGITVVCLALFGFIRKGCVCPVGSIQNLLLVLHDPTYGAPWHVVALFVLPLLAALAFGRVFCGGVCPLGAIQDLVVLKPIRLPSWLGRTLELGPYLVLGLTAVLVTRGAGFIVCRLDPFVGLFRFSGPYGWLLVGGGVLVLGMFVARPYCRFFCPYGVLLKAASHLSRRHLTITPDTCVHCRLCERACPFDAIAIPGPAVQEPRRRGVRRLAWLFLLVPLLVVVGGAVGRQFEPLLARAHPTIWLAESVLTEGAADAKVIRQAVVQSDGGVDALLAKAMQARAPLRTAAVLLGAFMGLVVGVRLIKLSVYRTATDHHPDRGRCFSCGRCFAACPQEQVRRRGKRSAGAAGAGEEGA